MPTLLCFAVKQEAKFIERGAFRILITGMGRKNAEKSLRRELAAGRPDLVLTCGFAGGLNPRLKLLTVVFEADAGTGLPEKLQAVGAQPARFHCADHVVVSAAEKQSLWQTTSADAVEMESSAIRALCREQNIPSATIRVISDTAQEDLPLDFNALMTSRERVNFVKLAGKLLGGPGRIPQLVRFQKQTVSAARALADVLEQLLAGGWE